MGGARNKKRDGGDQALKREGASIPPNAFQGQGPLQAFLAKSGYMIHNAFGSCFGTATDLAIRVLASDKDDDPNAQLSDLKDCYYFIYDVERRDMCQKEMLAALAPDNGDNARRADINNALAEVKQEIDDGVKFRMRGGDDDGHHITAKEWETFQAACFDGSLERKLAEEKSRRNPEAGGLGDQTHSECMAVLVERVLLRDLKIEERLKLEELSDAISIYMSPHMQEAGVFHPPKADFEPKPGKEMPIRPSNQDVHVVGPVANVLVPTSIQKKDEARKKAMIIQETKTAAEIEKMPPICANAAMLSVNDIYEKTYKEKWFDAFMANYVSVFPYEDRRNTTGIVINFAGHAVNLSVKCDRDNLEQQFVMLVDPNRMDELMSGACFYRVFDEDKRDAEMERLGSKVAALFKQHANSTLNPIGSMVILASDYVSENDIGVKQMPKFDDSDDEFEFDEVGSQFGSDFEAGSDFGDDVSSDLGDAPSPEEEQSHSAERPLQGFGSSSHSIFSTGPEKPAESPEQSPKRKKPRFGGGGDEGDGE